MADARRAWARALRSSAPGPRARAAYAAALDGIALALAREGGEGRLELYLEDPAVPAARKAELLSGALDAVNSAGAGDLEPGARGAVEAGAFGTVEAGAGEVFSRFLLLLARKGRLGLLREIAATYRRLEDEATGLVRLRVEAAREPAPGLLEAFAAAWAKASGARDCAAELRLEPELVAGYRLRSGSLRIDYSAKGRLERLRAALASAASPGGQSPTRGGPEAGNEGTPA